jgi:hypothetical protein
VTLSSWDIDELNRVGGAYQMRVAGRRSGGSLITSAVARSATLKLLPQAN